MMYALRFFPAVTTALLVISGCDSPTRDHNLGTERTSRMPSIHESPSVGPAGRQVLFGDLHVHTGYSIDAFIYDVFNGPSDAYRFGRGESIPHPAGYEVRIGRPLDFMAVTDHAKYMAVFQQLTDPSHPLSDHPLSESLTSADPNTRRLGLEQVMSRIRTGQPIQADLTRPEWASDVWRTTIAAADEYYEPGRFTTFVGYEWTAMPDGHNLHRNVIFRTSTVSRVPFSSLDSNDPSDLWKWMDRQRDLGIELLAIPHNANVSNGLMYPDLPTIVDKLGPDYVDQRNRNEPVNEIVQIKGQSETHPILSPYDEYANFELFERKLGDFSAVDTVQNSYARQALKNGLLIDAQLDGNPYKFGMIGSSDTHNGAMSLEEDEYFGKAGNLDGVAEVRLGRTRTPMTEVIQDWGSGGIAGVWAEENTREAIFDALVRKETFATSGPRISLRFFAGWNLPENLLTQTDWPRIAYENGVAMGSDLILGAAGGEPRFLVWAAKDPDGANLDRVQIVKGWLGADGSLHEDVYDVVWSGDRAKGSDGKLPPVANTVNIEEATFSNTVGAVELQTIWRDPDFDPTERAFYYLRVLEIPTPRWSTYDAARIGVATLTHKPATIQERAYSSPIWYTSDNQ